MASAAVSQLPPSGGGGGAAGSSSSSLEKGRQIPVVCPGHTRPLAELQFCLVQEEQQDKPRTLLVSACHDKLPMLRDGTSGDWIGTFSGHKGAVWSCRLDPSGNLAATASGDFSVKVWDAILGRALWHFPHGHIVKTCDFSPNSEKLATGGHEGILRIYPLKEIANQHKPNAITASNDSKIRARMEITQSPTTKLTISKCSWISNDVVLAACSDGKVRAWDVSNPQQPPSEPLYQLETRDEVEIRDMEVSNDKKTLTVAACDKVYFFNLENKSLLHVYSMPVHFRNEGGASLHPSKTKFVAGGSDLWVRVFDFETGKELECHKGHHGPIRCIRYSPDGAIYASGSEDGTIRLWKTDP